MLSDGIDWIGSHFTVTVGFEASQEAWWEDSRLRLCQFHHTEEKADSFRFWGELSLKLWNHCVTTEYKSRLTTCLSRQQTSRHHTCRHTHTSNKSTAVGHHPCFVCLLPSAAVISVIGGADGWRWPLVLCGWWMVTVSARLISLN